MFLSSAVRCTLTILLPIFVFAACSDINDEAPAGNSSSINSGGISSTGGGGSSSAGFVDNGARFISFEWQTTTSWASRTWSYQPISAVSYTNGRYEFILGAYANSASNSDVIIFSSSGATDSNWNNRYYEVVMRLQGVVLGINSVRITVLDDGRISGLFRATFGGFTVTGSGYQAALRNGVIQASSYRTYSGAPIHTAEYVKARKNLALLGINDVDEEFQGEEFARLPLEKCL